MAQQFYYSYAEIDPSTNMCIGVASSTAAYTEEELAQYNYVAIPVYDEEYCFKYYINGNWYVDAAGTTPWTSSLL